MTGFSSGDLEAACRATNRTTHGHGAYFEDNVSELILDRCIVCHKVADQLERHASMRPQRGGFNNNYDVLAAYIGR